MANPPYPPNPGMPMGQPPMGPGPMPTGNGPMMPGPGPGPMPGPGGMPPRPNVVRRGTSRAVPVVVSAGLAVGTFCGLLFGLGTGDDDAIAATGDEAADPAETQPTPTPEPTAPTTPTPQPTAPTTPTTTATSGEGSGSAAGAGTDATASAAGAVPAGGEGSAAGAGSGSAADPTAGSGSATPAVAKAVLTIELAPAAVVDKAKISVDGKELDGNTLELELPAGGKKDVQVVVKASGYKTVEQNVSVEGDVTVKLELVKRPSGGGVRPPKRPSRPPGGGLIDI